MRETANGIAVAMANVAHHILRGGRARGHDIGRVCSKRLQGVPSALGIGLG